MAHVALHRFPGWEFVVVEKIEVALLMVAGPAAETVRGGSRNELTGGVGSTTTEQQFACKMKHN